MSDVVTFEGVIYATSDLSEETLHMLKKLNYADARLRQLKNERAVSETARRAYAQAFSLESQKHLG